MCPWRNGKLILISYQKPSLVLIMIFLLWMTACSPGLPVISIPTEPVPLPSETAGETDIPVITPLPSPTTEILPARVILLAPPGSDPLLVGEVQSILEDLVPRAEYQLETTSSLSSEQVTPDVYMVVGLPPDTGIENLAASAGGTKFFAIGIPGLPGSANLTSAFFQQDRADLQGFMGGVIAAVVTPDWRIGVISVSDTTDGTMARDSFINGAIYFCGTCRQIYPPFFDSQNQLIQYPLYVELPAAASDNEWQSAADYLIERGIETVYVFPEAGGEGLFNYLAESGINLISGVAPPEGLQENWVASIYSDPSSSWNALLEQAILDQELPQVSSELQIGHVNPELLSPGRQMLVEAVMEDLIAGYIEAGFVEETVNEP
jgi:hypothetical protein